MEEDPADPLKPKSHRDVQQGPKTIFKIIPEQWNNVPTIVYDAIYKLISTIDGNEMRREMMEKEAF